MNVEQEIKTTAEAGRLNDACTLGLRAYGPEVMSYLHAFLDDGDAASEVFSELLLKVWAGLPQFRWQCSFRTWLYAIARRALIDHTRVRSKRRRDRNLSSVQDQLVVQARTASLPYLKTDARRRFRELREQLDSEDQTILILRVDRNLSWQEIARVLADDDLPDDELQRAAAALRKRFQRVKEDLRKRME